MKVTKYLRRLIGSFSLITAVAFGQQKPVVDAQAIKTWTEITRPQISNDGKHFSFFYESQTQENKALVLQAVSGNWIKRITGLPEVVFSDDSREAVFLNGHDSLCFVSLGKDKVDIIPNVQFYKLFMQGKTEWIGYILKNKELVVRKLSGEHEQHYDNIAQFLTDESGKNIVLIIEKDSMQKIEWVDLIHLKRTIVWKGKGVQSLILDASGSQLVFQQLATNQNNPQTIWYYKSGDACAIKLLDSTVAGIEKGLELASVDRFSKSGTDLFFRLKEKNNPPPDPDAVKLDVWSYTDIRLQSHELGHIQPSMYYAAINLATHSIVRLQREGEGADIGSIQFVKSDDLLPVYPCNYDMSLDMEFAWNKGYKTGVSLVSTRTGERKAFVKDIVKGELSYGGKYLIGQDKTEGDFYCYDIGSGKIINITQQLPIPSIYPDFDRPLAGRTPRGLVVIGWLKDDKAVLFEDGYDIWQLDPANKIAPLNLTNGDGRKNKRRFSLLFWDYGLGTKSNNQRLLLRVFNRETKEEGFSSLILGKQQTPELSLIGPYNYSGLHGEAKKARYADVYLIGRNSCGESENYFLTTDFKVLTRLTDNKPEKNYNWLTAELHTFKTTDGKTTQGVLYKPENMDSVKKYPVIFLYYERLSDELNEYKKPAPAIGEINIPWFTSRGYLVFTPDIHYTVGMPGESALNAVVGAANYLKQFSYVDFNRMGIQGHSFGGYETNYIITHTNIFAAACSAAGLSDQISHYGGLFRDNTSSQPLAEVSQTRIGSTLWEHPDLYIKNSPIFRVDQITTPLLMMNCKNDEAVPFSQGVEMITAMRRLGKRGWMLQYDDGGHTLNDKDGMDFLVRMNQFFDHYLKNSPAPRWMLEGIPAKLKGLITGLEIDSSGITPGAGLSVSPSRK